MSFNQINGLSHLAARNVKSKVERSTLEQDGVRATVRNSGHGALLWSDADLERSLNLALADYQQGTPIWIFGYGSLIWNPMFTFAERRVAKLRGYHRGFYIWSKINRGSPEKPGLVLGLDRGGSCGGIAYQLHSHSVEEEFKLLWRREMLAGFYQPRWVNVSTSSGNTRAMTFVVDRSEPGYTGRLSDESIVTTAIGAHGHYGSCAEYLLETANSLEHNGIRDRRMQRLARLLKARHDASDSG